MSWPSSSRWVANEWTEGMARRLLGDPGAADGILHRSLENGFVEVVAATLGAEAVHVQARGGGDPLPPPGPGRRSGTCASARWPARPSRRRAGGRLDVAR